MNADHQSASLDAVDLRPVDREPYLQAYLGAYLEPYLEPYRERAGRLPEDRGPAAESGPVERRLDDPEAPDQEPMDREPYLQAYLEPYLEAYLEPCLEPVDLEVADPKAAGPEPASPEPADAGPVALEAADSERAEVAPDELPAGDPEPADSEPEGEEAGDLQLPDLEVDELRSGDGESVELQPGHGRRGREEAARLATSIRWTPARQSWTPLASASLVAGQVRRQLVPCLSALRSVGLDGCAYQLQRLDHVLERIAMVPEAPIAHGSTDR
jgi:hypothetical protein